MGRSVCVAIPVKDGADYLGAAIESVLAQEGVELAVRVRDNGSADDSVAIAERYAAADPRVSVAVNETDVGYYGSLNRVLAETDAEFYVPFAADDVMYPGNLAPKVDALQDPSIAFAHARAELIDAHGNPIGEWPDLGGIPPLTAAPDYVRHVLPLNAVHTQATVIRSDALRSLGGFDGRPVYCSDWLAYIRLSMRGAVATFQERTIGNRVHGASGSSTLTTSGINGRDVPATLDHVFGDPAMPGELQAQRDELAARALVAIGGQLSDAGRRRVAEGFAGYMLISRAFTRTPYDPALYAHYHSLVATAGLVPPPRQFEAAAAAPAGPEEAGALARTAAGFGPLMERLHIAVEPERLDATMELLDPVFGDGHLDVVLVPADAPAQVIEPGRLALARWGSPFVALAEGLGVPVHPWDVPNPFDEEPDFARWQMLEAESALV